MFNSGKNQIQMYTFKNMNNRHVIRIEKHRFAPVLGRININVTI
jgi:predicted component of type VI protein secretion system